MVRGVAPQCAQAHLALRPISLRLRPPLLAAPSGALAPRAVRMHRAVADGLVDDDVAVANLYVVQAIWVGADPGLVLDGCSLASKIRQRHKIAGTALPTPRKRLFHAHRPFH